MGATPPAGVVQTTVRKGIAPKSEVSIVFTGPFEDSASGRLALRTATLFLQARLSDALREQLGATYAISAESETGRIRDRNITSRSTGRAIRRRSRARSSVCSRRWLRCGTRR